MRSDYQPRLSLENAEISDDLIRLTHNQRIWGFGLYFLYLHNIKGYRWNYKSVYRIYREPELNLPVKPRKCIVREKPEPLVPKAINPCLSMDFIHDQLADGRSFRLLNIIDDFNHEAFAMDLTSRYRLRALWGALEQVIEWFGKSKVIRSDNGPEYISSKLANWAQKYGIRLEHIQPGNPQSNAYVKCYNYTARYDCLGHYLFDTIPQVQEHATQWIWTYSQERPNIALGGISPKHKLALVT